jgi:putative DNA primase/helicase
MPKAQCPKFESFLVDIMPDPDMRAFLQRIFGYCLTASTIEQAFFIFWGSGNNGKSVLMNLMRAAMGEYAMNSPVSTFLAKREGNGGSEASPDLARLPGARLVTAAEPPEGARLDEAKVKEMSSGELMTARHLNQGFFDYRPVFKAIISTNHRPTIRGADHGIWRRIRLVPFTVQIEADKVDRNLEAKLMKELPGILQWMITGAEEWFAVGLRPPAKAIAAVEDYRASEDPVGEFLKARCEITRDAQDPSTGRAYEISAKRLRAEYKAWCEEEGLEPLGAKDLWQQGDRPRDHHAQEHGADPVRGRASQQRPHSRPGRMTGRMREQGTIGASKGRARRNILSVRSRALTQVAYRFPPLLPHPPWIL